MKSDSPVKRRNDTKCFERQRVHICLEGYIGSLNMTYCFSLFTGVTTKRRPDWLRYQWETDQGAAWKENSHLALYTWDYLFAIDIVFGQFSRAHEGHRQGEVVKDPVTALECAATTKPCKNLNRGLYTSFLDDCGLYTRGRGARLGVGGGRGEGECCKVYKGVSVNMLLPLLIATIYWTFSLLCTFCFSYALESNFTETDVA